MTNVYLNDLQVNTLDIPAGLVSQYKFDEHVGGSGIEKYRTFEGYTPLIGTELLTNGQFETDLSGWTQQAGTWTRVTTQKKFGTASVQVALTGSDKILSRQLTGLTVGAQYVFTGWIRTASAVGSGNFARLDFATSSGTGSFTGHQAQPAGQEWTYVYTFWTATQDSIFVRAVATSGATSGTAEYDGLSVIRVKDADGNSTLAFDTNSTTGWTISGGAGGSSIQGVVPSPHGMAIRADFGTSDFSNLTYDHSAQDFTKFRRINFWVRKISGTATTLTWAIRDTGFSSTGQASGSSGTLTTGVWQFVSSAITTVDDVSNAGRFFFEKPGTSVTLVAEVSSVKFSHEDLSVGQGHGLLSRMEDTNLVGYWALDETTGTDGANLVANPGFETYTTTPGVPDSWTGTGVSTQYIKETTIIHSGANALKIEASSTTAEIQMNSLAVTAGKSYYWEAWGRTSGQATEECRVGIFNVTDAITPSSQNGTVGTTTWQKFSGTFTALAGKTYRLFARDSNTESGAIVYFDDFLVQEIQAKDRSGAGLHGTLNGGTNTAGPTINVTGAKTGFGTAYDFDGVDDYVITPNVTGLSGATAVTLAAWVNPDSVTGTKIFLDSNAISGLYLGTSGTSWRFSTRDTGGVQNTINAGTATIGQWALIVGTHDGTTMRLYVNGALISSTVCSLGALASATVELGRFDNTILFDGKMQQARVYNRALGPAEIAQLYSDTVTRIGQIFTVLGSETIEQSTDKKEGTYAIKINATASSSGLRIQTPYRFDITPYTHAALWAKTSASDGLTIRIGTDSSNYLTWAFTPGTAFSYQIFDFSAPTSTVGTPDMTRIDYIRIGDLNAGNSMWVDSVKLMNWKENSDWRYITESTLTSGYMLSNAATNSTTTAANGDYIEIANVPAISTTMDGHFYASGNGTARAFTITVGSNTAQSKTAASTAIASQTISNVITVSALTGSSEQSIRFTTSGAYGIRITPDIRFTEVGTLPYVALATTSAYDGTIVPTNLNFGPIGVTGHFSRGLQFDRFNDRIAVPDIADMANIMLLETGSFTISAWFKCLGSAPGGDSVIVARTGFHSGLLQSSANNGRSVSFKVYGSGVPYAVSYVLPDDSAFHHLVGVYNNRFMEFYVDGVLVGTTIHSGTFDATGDFSIGGVGSAGVYYANGVIDDVQFYDEALNGTDVEHLYENNFPSSIQANVTGYAIDKSYRVINESIYGHTSGVIYPSSGDVEKYRFEISLLARPAIEFSTLLDQAKLVYQELHKPVTLHEPILISTDDTPIYLNYKEVYVIPEEFTFKLNGSEGKKHVNLEIDCIVLGVSTALGGTVDPNNPWN